MRAPLRDFDLTWLEEPVWPPEDHAGLARVRREGAADRRRRKRRAACTISTPPSQPARRTSRSPASSRSAARRRCSRSPRWPRRTACGWCRTTPISAPGFLASLHVNATLAPDAPFERLFIDMEANPYARTGGGGGRQGEGAGPAPASAAIPIPAVLRRYQLAEPTVHRLRGKELRPLPLREGVGEGDRAARTLPRPASLQGEGAGPDFTASLPVEGPDVKITRLRTQVVHLPIDPPILTAILGTIAPPTAC